MDVVSDRDEQFRQFQATEMQRQSALMQRQADHLRVIRNLIATWFLLSVLGVLIAVVASSQSL